MWLFLLMTVLFSTLSAILPYFYKIFVDALSDSNFDKLLAILALYVGVRLAAVFLNAISRTLGDLIMIDASADIKTTVFKKIQDLDFAFHSTKSSGALISVIKRGGNAFWNFFLTIHFDFIDVGVSFAVMFYFFSGIDWRIAIFALISLLVSLVAARFVIPHNIRMRRNLNKEEDKITGIVVDNMINYDTVKMFSKEDWELARLKRAYKNWKKWLWKFGLSFRYISLSIGSILNISIFLILLVVIRQAEAFQIGAGDFVLVIAFLNQFNSRVSNLVWNLQSLAQNFTDIEKYFGILDQDILIKDPLKPVGVEKILGEVEFKNVSFAYGEKEKDAVKSINLKVRQGQSIALVGRSGAGKTTLIKLLMRFYDVDKGKVSVDGIGVADFTKSDLRSFVGIVPQEPILFNNTVGYNIAYGKERASKKEIVAAAKLANIHSFIESLPKKYNTVVGERGIKLSGGQKQRLAIARMILADPDIIIFDEATSQLDSENEALIQEAFWKVAHDKTTIIIAHRLSTAMRADKIVVMEKGRIVESGPHKVLLNKKGGLYKYFWDLQINID